MSKISIIVPVYNVKDYLNKCLDSVLSQSFTDFEVLCIDDCSNDGSLEILKDYAKKDSRIKLILNKKNLKAAGSRNVGLDNAQGEYIYFLDADDYIDPEYLEEMYNMACSKSSDIVMNLNIHTNSNGEEFIYVHPNMPAIPKEGCYIDSVTSIDKSFCVVWMRLFKRDFLEENKIRYMAVNMTEDYVFHYIPSVYAFFIYAFNGENSYHYVLRDDSVSGIVKTNNQRDYLTMKAYDLIFDSLLERNLLDKNKAKLFNVSGFFKVDTKEKFELYHWYFEKIKNVFKPHVEMYNEMDIFFFDSILSCNSFEEYINKYSPNVAIAFVRNKGMKK